MEKVNKRSWRKYFKKTLSAPVSPLLEIAVKENPYKSGLAYDLGCGSGRDSLWLARHKWDVVSVDVSEDALKILDSLKKPSDTINIIQCNFEDLRLLPCQLVHGNYSFPFCKPKSFRKFWNNIRKSLQPGGTLSGQLFGNNDEWSKNSLLTFHSKKDWDFLMKNYDILFFDETEEKGRTALGKTKYWHLYSFVLQKRS